MIDTKKIGLKVLEIRNKAGKTQEQFAETLNVATETVSNIERGVVLLSTETLCAIAEVYHVSADEILGFDFK